MFRVFVNLKYINNKLTPKQTGIIIGATGDAHVAEAVVGQPTSITVNDKPKRLTIPCAAGPNVPVSKSTTSPIPTNPIPIVRPDFKALVNLILNTKPNNNIVIGRITVAPMLSMYCKIGRASCRERV